MANVIQAPSMVQSMIAPDIATQQMQLQRQQQMIDMLKQGALDPIQSQTVQGGNGSPNVAVKTSPFQALAKILQGGAAGYMQQNSDAKNLALNQQMAQRYSEALNGNNQAAPQPSANETPLAAANGDPLQHVQQAPDSNIGNQSTPLVAALRQGAPDQGQQPVSQKDQRFGMANMLRGSIIGQIGGDAASKAYWDDSARTTEQKNWTAQGIDPRQMGTLTIAKATKEGTQSFQPGQTNILPTGRRIVAPDFNTGVAGGFDAQGNPTSSPIVGATPIAAGRAGAIAGATKAAELPYAPPTTVTTPNGPMLMTPQQQIDAANGGGSSNNPGNLRPPGASTGFQSYGSPEEGLAAIDKNLQSYGKQGVNTVAGIISKWAPPSENNMPAYIADVSKRLGLDPNQPLDMNNPIVRQSLSTAITLHEQGPSKVFGGAQKSQGMALQTPEQAKVNEAKGDAAIQGAKISAAADPLFSAIKDARGLVNQLPYGSSAPLEEWAADQKYIVGNPDKAAAIAKWNNLMGNFTMNGIASSGLGRMDIPIVNAINRASNVPMDAAPAAKLAALDQIEANLKRHVASTYNVVPRLNQSGITANTAVAPMAPNTSGGMPSMSDIQAEIARRRGGR